MAAQLSHFHRREGYGGTGGAPCSGSLPRPGQSPPALGLPCPWGLRRISPPHPVSPLCDWVLWLHHCCRWGLGSILLGPPDMAALSQVILGWPRGSPSRGGTPPVLPCPAAQVGIQPREMPRSLPTCCSHVVGRAGREYPYLGQPNGVFGFWDFFTQVFG